MRLKTIRLKDFLAHSKTEVALDGVPVALLVGPNAAGKSSVVDAVRWTLLNRCRDLAAADNKRLIRRGAETCKVEIVADYGEGELVASRTPSGGTPKGEEIRALLGIPDAGALEAALDAGRFLALESKERKQLVFKLAGAEVSEALLRSHGIDDPEVLRLCLTKGFGGGETHAAERKRQSRRALDEIHAPEPVDETFAVGEATYSLSQVDPQNATNSLAKVRRDRDEATRAVTAALERLAAHERTMAARVPAVDALQSARRIIEATKEKVAKAAAERGDPAAIRRQAAEYSPAAGEAVPTAPVGFMPAPEPAVVHLAGTVKGLEAHVKVASASPWARVAEIADGLNAISKLHADELRALAQKNGGVEKARLEHDLEGARTALADAEAEAARVRAANEAGKRAYEERLGAWAKAKQERDARVSAATRAYMDLTAKAEAIERAAQQDAASIESAKASVRAAEARLTGIDQAAAAAPTDDIPALEATVTALDERIARGEVIATQVRNFHQAAAAFVQAGERRAQLLEEANRYEAMEHALRPSGVMSTLVAAPLAKLRETLDAVAKTMLTGTLRLTDNWDVLYCDEPVSLASTSERWRVGAALAIAVGAVSGLRWAVLDEASVCVGKARDALLSTLLGARSFFDQVVLVGSRSEAEMATLAPPPAELATTVGVWRVEAGKVSRVVASASAVAA